MCRRQTVIPQNRGWSEGVATDAAVCDDFLEPIECGVVPPLAEIVDPLLHLVGPPRRHDGNQVRTVDPEGDAILRLEPTQDGQTNQRIQREGMSVVTVALHE